MPGEVTTEPSIKKPKDRRQPNGKKDSTRAKQSLKPKPVIKKELKQRRISSYFTRSSVTSFTNAQLTDMVLELQKHVKQMQKLLKKKKKKTHGRQTSFNTVRSRCKNIGTSNQSEQEAPSDQVIFDLLLHILLQ